MLTQDINSKLDNVEVSAVETVQTWLVNQLAKQLRINPHTIKLDELLTRYGLDSIDSVTIVGDLEDWLQADLPSTLFWDHPTIEKAARHLVEDMGITPGAELAAAEPTAAPTKEEAAPTGKGWGGFWGKIGG